MKFGRRAFLQFTAGVVGGTLLTPIPWKLADDSAIWTQNWPWEPSPERGEITRKASVCLMCEGGGGCGIEASLVNGHRAISIDGNKGHPVNRGGICPLGASGLQFLYAPYRVTQPMKQTKQRGDVTGFKKIGWDEATAELQGLLDGLRNEGKPQALAGITGQTRSSMYTLWQQFFAAYGSPNLFTMPAAADSQALAASLALGKAAPIAFAIERASFIFSFAGNLLERCAAPGRAQAAFGMWAEPEPGKAPVRVVQVESRCSLSAAKADEWVPVKPGTEAAFALGIAHVLIRDKLYDAEFVLQNTFGFEDWTDAHGRTRQGFKNFVMANYSPEKVAEITGADEYRMVELAREFASQKDSVAIWGNSNGDSPNILYHDLVFLALNAIAGKLRPTATVGLAADLPLGKLPEITPDAMAHQGMQNPRVDLAAGPKVPSPGNAVHAFLDTVANKAGYPVDVLLVHEANPAYSLPEAQLFKAAAANVGKVVSFSPYMDETTLYADLILPNHNALERMDDVTGLDGACYAYYAVASPILPPQQDTRSTGDVVIEVSKKLQGTIKDNIPWGSYEEYLKERVKGLAQSGRGAVADADAKPWALLPGQSIKPNFKDEGDLWTKLTEGMCWYDAPNPVMENIRTSSGRYEIALQALDEKGFASGDDAMYLPHYAPLQPSGEEKDYPLLLVSHQMLNLASGFLPNPPFLNKTLLDTLLLGNDQFVDLNPKTAASMGFSEGDYAFVRTPQGEVRVRIHLSAGVQPGMVLVAQGFGHTAYDEYIKGKGVNANNVTEVQIDPLTGLGTVWATRAQLRRA